MSFHREECDGYKAGDLIRLGNWPFADAVILGFDDDGYAELHRPYIYASSVGTTGPSPLLGHERMIFSTKSLKCYEHLENDGRRRV